MDVILDFLLANTGENIISLITLACTVIIYRHQTRQTKALKDVTGANTILMRQVLKEIHRRCQQHHKTSNNDWKQWHEVYDIYRKLGGNGVAVGWNKDIEQWRKF